MVQGGRQPFSKKKEDGQKAKDFRAIFFSTEADSQYPGFCIACFSSAVSGLPPVFILSRKVCGMGLR